MGLRGYFGRTGMLLGLAGHATQAASGKTPQPEPEPEPALFLRFSSLI